MSIHAECVMLNKGPHIGAAVQFLCDVCAPDDPTCRQDLSDPPRAERGGVGLAGGRSLCDGMMRRQPYQPLLWGRSRTVPGGLPAAACGAHARTQFLSVSAHMRRQRGAM